MTNSSVGRLGTTPEEGVKAPCVVASTSNITLSGEQTIGSTAVTAGDRVLVAGQTNAADNGIYDAAIGAWTRATDWNDNNDVISGMLVVVPNLMYQVSFSGTFALGSTEVTFNTLQAVTTAFQEFTATANQTVFTLTTMTYVPGDNQLGVWVNGAMLYPSDYTQTSSTVVTLDSGVPAGAKVMFLTGMRTVDGSTVLAANTTYTPAGTGAVTTNVQDHLREVSVSVTSFGATAGDGTDDRTAIQAAIDYVASLGGGEVFFPYGVFRVSRVKGTNDKWGLNISTSNIRLTGPGTLRRHDTDISAVANAYPILFVGVVDNDAGAQVTNTVIDGLTFQGEDTRHATSGSSLHDMRTAIEFKNTKNTRVRRCTFTSVDSHAIFYQKPYQYDEENAAYYNTTKNYDAVVSDCRFIAASHTTPGRALLHAVDLSGVDFARVSGCYFEWCDDGVAGTGTYDDLVDLETDTWTPTAFSAVKRCGRFWSITDNVFHNSAEHSVYPEGMDVKVTGNTFSTDSTTYCTGVPISIRSRNVTVTGNTVHNYPLALNIAEPSFSVTATGNTFHTIGNSTGGIIEVNGDTLSAYIDARGYLSTYYPVSDITITGNTLTMNSAAQTGLNGIALRLVGKSSSDANYPEGDVNDVTFSGNTIQNHRHGVYLVGAIMRRVNVVGNTWLAKSFTSASFAAGTALETQSIVLVNSANAAALGDMSFTGNLVHGSTYLFSTHDGGGTSVYLPALIEGNKLDYIKNFKTSDMRVPAIPLAWMRGNRGNYFLDRTTWLGTGALDNSLFDGTTDNTAKKYCVVYDGTNVDFFTDDAGTHLQLNP